MQRAQLAGSWRCSPPLARGKRSPAAPLQRGTEKGRTYRQINDPRPCVSAFLPATGRAKSRGTSRRGRPRASRRLRRRCFPIFGRVVSDIVDLLVVPFFSFPILRTISSSLQFLDLKVSAASSHLPLSQARYFALRTAHCRCFSLHPREAEASAHTPLLPSSLHQEEKKNTYHEMPHIPGHDPDIARPKIKRACRPLRRKDGNSRSALDEKAPLVGVGVPVHLSQRTGADDGVRGGDGLG
jgi:hypothetical protein